ncbi:MAG: phosphoribosylaminoimidazole carboxylase ade2 [Vezdaea aestivalis]|nr:MAG: phosphoribosylaminoimidazole carboxylase ade2 [Vezdaea aestivalis]
MAKKKVVGVLGGGQLGRLLLTPAEAMDIKVITLDRAGCPAALKNPNHLNGSFTNAHDVRRLASKCDILTVEIEHVDTKVLEEIAEKGINGRRVEVQPHWRTLRIIQDKFLQKERVRQYGIATADYVDLKDHSVDELRDIGKKFGYPFMLKSRTLAYDGRGNVPVNSAEESELTFALEALKGNKLYAERWAPFKAELAVMIVKTNDEASANYEQETLAYPVVETVHEDSICKLVYAPARNISPKTEGRAIQLARKTISAFEGRGIFGVELFLLENDELLVNEIAPRPHNSGHYTIEACGLSQYASHLRSILKLPFPRAVMAVDKASLTPGTAISIKQPAVMLNILGGARTDSHLEVENEAYDVFDASVQMYGKPEARPGRKMGHITVTAPTMETAEARIKPLIAAVDRIRSERNVPNTEQRSDKRQEDMQQPSNGSFALVGVTMGSMSDLPVLKPGLAILEEFNVPFEVRITSAHRTPHLMMEYASDAASRGIRVIVAAAGGAAHLPGMVASETPLPVIGVPVKGSSLDGLDSLYSILQMPRGVPVATVGINNSSNAALLALRILGASDLGIHRQVQDYAGKKGDESRATDGQLLELGWKDCGA